MKLSDGTSIDNLVDEVISLRAINAELVAALQAMYEEFQHSNDFRPDSKVARKARAALVKAKGEI